MNQKAKIFSLIMIGLGIGLFIYRINLPEHIAPNGVVYDNLGAITAGCISIFIGVATYIISFIISKVKNRGALVYEQKN